MEAVGTGVVELKLKLPGGQSKIGRLDEVLYVPTLAYNLLSVPKVTEAGKTVKFGETQGELIGSQGEIVGIASKAGSLYYLNCEPFSQLVNSASHSRENLWHRRFGHLGERNLQMLKKVDLVKGFDYNVSKDVKFCESCVSGKIHRTPFPKSGRERAEEPLGLVHSDLCGKISSPSLGQAEYFVTFIDDKTHYVWVSVVKHKHQVFQKFVEWKALVEKSSGHKIKKFRTDNGGEYMSAEFENYLKKEGIEHQYTMSKTPEQNGVSERMNRTLVESVRSMLADSGLPHKFWAEALSTAAYLINRSPTKTLHEMTPFEAWYGKKPNVSHFRVFGCSAYVHIPKDQRKKLDPKAKKCVFLGYGATRKGYRLYDQKTSTIVHSRDVVFDELSRGYEGEKEKHLIQIENLTDENPDTSNPAEEATRAESNEVNPGGGDTQPIDSIDRAEDSTDAPVLPRRSTRVSQRPDYYGVWVYTATEQHEEPHAVSEALSSTEKDQWKSAMQMEMDSIHSNDVWDLVELPAHRKAIGSKWVFRKKMNADGSVEQYKARLVAQG